MRLLMAALVLAGIALAQSHYTELLNQSHVLEASGAQRLETALVANPDDVQARSLLIGWYFQNAQFPAMREHLCSLIESHPEAPVLDYPMAPFPRTSPVGDESAYRRAKELWQAHRYSADSAVLRHAAFFFAEGGEPEVAEELLNRDLRRHPNDPEPPRRLGMLYARVASETLVNPNPSTVGPYYSPAFAERARIALENVDDTRILRAASVLLLSFPGRRPLPDSWSAALARIADAQPPGQRDAATNAVARPPTLPPGRIIRTVPPEHPPLARQARIQGTVRLMIKLGSDGSLKAVTVLSGHPLLVPSALAAVKQWTFSPAAAEEAGVVEVPFTLPIP